MIIEWGIDVEQLKEDVRQGRISLERLIELLGMLQRQLREAQGQLQQAKQQLERAKQRIGELEEKLGSAGKNAVSEAYSVQAEEQRQEARRKKGRKRKRSKRRGRLSTAEKVAQAERTEAVYPVGVAKEDCKLSHTRPVWRLEGGRAVLVAYEIYRGPKGQYGQIGGVLGRSEFGIEIVLAIAYQVYAEGLSFDQVCRLLAFFQNLKLSKSQAEALLRQLAHHWEEEFDMLCLLLAQSAVVHTDETSWSRPPLRGGARSAWAFLSEKVRLLFFGVRKDSETLKEILDPATLAGVVISDDAAVYREFSQSQKCWAHLLRGGDQANAAGAGQCRVPRADRWAFGDLPAGLPGAA
ncbi:MAG: transposase [Phycisphaerae bacterium]